ncbi:MAG TPA: CRTAC1 family protein [Vicinamibacteria bacterium]
MRILLPAAFALLCLANGGTPQATTPPRVATPAQPRFRLTDATAGSGLDFVHFSGARDRKDYIFEAKGGGAAALDIDNDGWLDVVFAQGSTLERHRSGSSPGPAVYRNRGDGSFENVSARAGLAARGWGMGVAAADYDNDGFTDLYLTNLGPDVLYRNNGDGSFSDVTARTGLSVPGWSASAAFFDADRDGFLDLYVARYLDVGPDALPQERGGGSCSYLGVSVLCGPRGLPGAPDAFFRNHAGGRFEEQSEASGLVDRERYFGLGVVASDLDGDGDTDLYVGNDATPSLLFVNRGDGRFDERGLSSGLALSGDGNEQASMGVDAADYDNDGRPDVYATHFASDYSTLYRNTGGLQFDDVTLRARIRDTAYVSWGTRFVDLDHDGWKDLVKVNGHVYPHLRGAASGERYEQPALTVYLNERDGTFRTASGEIGKDASKPVVGRGAAFADFDNDGDVDVLVACLDSPPLLLRNDQAAKRHWLMLRTVGRRSNRDGMGARVSVRTGALEQTWEIKRTVGIFSASDPRAHFGLGDATKVDLLRIAWPSGKLDEFRDVAADAHYLVDEEKGLSREPMRGR